ncbi:MAG: hypothetical protein ACFFDI_19460 [Promethearchaeota archaeon]
MRPKDLQTLFKQIINEGAASRRDLTMMAITHLCDLLLFESKATGETDVWEEAKILIEQLDVQAQEQQLFFIMVDALILRAKCAAVEGKLSQALKYYDEAQVIASEKKLGLWIQKVFVERKRFEEEFEKWRTLIQQNASLQERLKQARMEDYLQEVQKMLTLMKE